MSSCTHSVAAMAIRVLPLGAGQDVGRSCVLATVGGKTVMFDCGMHLGCVGRRRFPDFRVVSATGRYTEAISAVIVTHFHLDHCGALPLFTEVCGYSGPVVMSAPTRAMVPVMLEDYRRLTVERLGDTRFFTAAMVTACMAKAVTVMLGQTLVVDGDVEITTFYAGHVLGAVSVLVRCRGQSVLYTGDFNMCADRCLGVAKPPLYHAPDVLITESTFATTTRETKKAREAEFLDLVHAAVSKGNKVLVPVSAVGRAQELCLLLLAHWARLGTKVPVYFSAWLSEKAHFFYKHFAAWTNADAGHTADVSALAEIRTLASAQLSQQGPMVLFATPGMLSGGLSLQAFRAWCGEPGNHVIFPAYAFSGTIGNQVLSGNRSISLEEGGILDVKCKVTNLSFSAHTDAKGIMQMIRAVKPKHVVLVHGERGKMAILKQRIRKELCLPCYDPTNGAILDITAPSTRLIHVDSELMVLQRRVRAFMTPVAGVSGSGSGSGAGSGAGRGSGAGSGPGRMPLRQAVLINPGAGAGVFLVPAHRAAGAEGKPEPSSYSTSFEFAIPLATLVERFLKEQGRLGTGVWSDAVELRSGAVCTRAVGTSVVVELEAAEEVSGTGSTSSHARIRWSTTDGVCARQIEAACRSWPEYVGDRRGVTGSGRPAKRART